jgi:hypothetical protein
VTIYGIEFTSEHARIFAALAGVAIAALSFLVGRWSRHRQHVRFRQEDLVGSTLVSELYGFSTGPEGRPRLHIISQGGSQPLSDAFTNIDLVHHVARAAGRHPGLLQLKNPVAHRMMMDEGKDRITGLDPRANMDFMQGRPTRDDEVLFGFGAWAEGGDRRNGLHDEIGRLVQMVVATRHIADLANADFIGRLDVQHAGYKPRIARLHEFAREWQRLEALPRDQRHAATDKIWKVTVRSAMT